MGLPDTMQGQFNGIVDNFGTVCTIQYWSAGSIYYTAGSYDDETLQAGSSTVISGGCILQPIGQGDTQFIQQGKITIDDAKAYFAGSLTVISNAIVTIGNTGSQFTIIPDTIQRWEVSGAVIYQKAYLRTLPPS